MAVTEIPGDLFTARDVQALAHGCNTVGVMGAGVAALFARRYPQMEAEYRQLCRAGEFEPGQMMAWPLSKRRVIYNLFSQKRPGRDARLEWIQSSVRAMLEDATTRGVTRIAMPRIGAGIGGLAWDDVRRTLDVVSADFPEIELVVYVL